MGNLNITQVASSQNQKEVTINDADAKIESALTAFVAVDLTAGNVTLNAVQFRSGMLFNCTGHTVARDLTLPGNIERAIFMVRNGGTGVISLKKGTTTETIGVGETVYATTENNANGLTITSSSAFGFLELLDTPSSYSGQAGKFVRVNLAGNALEFFTIPYAIPIFVGGQPGANALVMQFVCIEAFTLPTSLTGSQGKAGTASVGNVHFDILKNGSDIGDIVFNVSNTASFTFPTPTSFTVGDLLQIIAPATPDANLADISITLVGVRS